ncbi:hypothetical protein FH972_005798 [Carpinus fangiana]|uniref:Leucine-rich repeat-containing N-terminal plant-type domain-containing protein n=1 Tax=Carpinus fangiana TaxID=176857 RepID=A0A5N6QS99_9ROSI|nr:hypothetical protein FH972_005798 [Carpinus fangiana]
MTPLSEVDDLQLIIKLVVSGSTPPYSLEAKLGDCRRARRYGCALPNATFPFAYESETLQRERERERERRKSQGVKKKVKQRRIWGHFACKKRPFSMHGSLLLLFSHSRVGLTSSEISSSAGSNHGISKLPTPYMRVLPDNMARKRHHHHTSSLLAVTTLPCMFLHVTLVSSYALALLKFKESLRNDTGLTSTWREGSTPPCKVNKSNWASGGPERSTVGDIAEVFDIQCWRVAAIVKAIKNVHFVVRFVGSIHLKEFHKSSLRVRRAWHNNQWSQLVGIGKVQENKQVVDNIGTLAVWQGSCLIRGGDGNKNVKEMWLPEENHGHCSEPPSEELLMVRNVPSKCLVVADIYIYIYIRSLS